MRRVTLLPSRERTEPNVVRRFYDLAAQGWQSGLDRIGYGQAYLNLASRAMALSTPDGPLRILDAGAGTGALTRAFVSVAPVACQCELLDLSENMLKEARRSLPFAVRTITGEVGNAPLDSTAYDRVLCGHVIEHCDDPANALGWIFERLKPGGVAMLSVSKPHWCTAILRWKYGNRAYRPDDFELLLADAGFAGVHRLPYDSGPPSRVSCGYLAQRPHPA